MPPPAAKPGREENMLILGYVGISSPALQRLHELGIVPREINPQRGFETFEIPNSAAGEFDYRCGTTYRASSLFLRDDPDWSIHTCASCGHTSPQRKE